MQGDQRGSATAEFAVVLPCLALLVAVVAAAGTGGRAQLQCHDAAWTAARLAARGEAPAVALAAAEALAPSGARVALGGDAVTVTSSVTAQVSLMPGDSRWRLGVSCSSTAWRETAGASVAAVTGPAGRAVGTGGEPVHGAAVAAGGSTQGVS